MCIDTGKESLMVFQQLLVIPRKPLAICGHVATFRVKAILVAKSSLDRIVQMNFFRPDTRR